MADPVTRTPPAPPSSGGGGKSLLKGKVAGIPKPVVVFGIAAGGALLFLWWRGRRSSAASSSPSATATATASAYTNAEAAEISALQSELQGLLAQQSAGGGTGSSAPSSPATSTATSTAPVHGKPTHAPVGTAGSITSSGARLSCGNLEFATSYRWRVWEATKAHPVVADHTTTYTTYSVTGLKPGKKYGWHVAGVNKAGQGPYSANQHFTTKGAGHLMHPGAATQAEAKT